MPWVEIPPDRLQHIGLFDHDLIADDGAFAWYRCPRGRVRIEKAAPRVWVEDLETAIQLRAVAVVVGN